MPRNRIIWIMIINAILSLLPRYCTSQRLESYCFRKKMVLINNKIIEHLHTNLVTAEPSRTGTRATPPCPTGDITTSHSRTRPQRARTSTPRSRGAGRCPCRASGWRLQTRKVGSQITAWLVWRDRDLLYHSVVDFSLSHFSHAV